MPTTSPQHHKILVSILAGLGFGLIFVSISGSCDANSNCVSQANRAIVLPLVAPTVSSEPTSEQGDLSTTRVAVKDDRPVPLQSAHVTLKEAQLAVSLSQTQLAQARINLIEFQAKYDSVKILSQQDRVSRQQLDTARAAIELAQLQHSLALMDVQECTAQLVAAKAEVSRLGRKANTTAEM
jgi:membrane fusion protein, multidrug efflux system